MDIGSIGSQLINSAYVPLSSSNPAREGRDSMEIGGFGEMLKRMQNNQKSEDSPFQASKKPPIDKNDKLYELCMELETFLIKNLIKSMRSTVQKTNLVDSGFAGQVYEDMLYDEYAKAYAKNANLGFAEMAYRELSGF